MKIRRDIFSFRNRVVVIIRHNFTQVYIHLLGILIHKASTIPGSIHLVIYLGRL